MNRGTQADPKEEARRQAEIEKQVRWAQRLLVAVGKEALNENIDWYVLHRTHPVELVSPISE